MDPNYVLLSSMLLLMMAGFASSDLAKDREECANQLVGLATCLPYVGGDAKAPTPDCCSGIKLVLQKSRKCLCVLVKDRNDPNLGLKINATLALGLPQLCHAPSNISECPSLLHLPPNSPDAKVFEEFANSANGNTSAPASNVKGNSGSNGSSGNIKNDGGTGMAKRQLRIDEMAWGVLITTITMALIHSLYMPNF